MNETNISTWTVDSSKERSFLSPTNYHDADQSLQIAIGNKLSPKPPSKTRTHRPSASYHSSTIEEDAEFGTTPHILQNERHPPLETSLQNGESVGHSHMEDADQAAPHRKHIKQDTITSLTTYTETYIHPSDRKAYASIEDEKDEEIADIDSMTCSSSRATHSQDTMKSKADHHSHAHTPLIHQTLNDTMDYTTKLMATIQQMEEQNHLKYKLRKCALKIKKLERQLMDEKAAHEKKAACLESIKSEWTQTNVDIERIEREKRALNESLKQLENVEQEKRLLEMKNLQLMQQHKLKELEIDKLNKEAMENNMKLQRTLEDRDNISAVSEAMREELTNKRAAIIRYKEIQKKLNDKINKYEMNEQTHAHSQQKLLSDTLYTAPDATTLYLKMNELERDTGLVQQIKDLEEKYNTQSREFMQLKLEHQSLKHSNQRLKKETHDFSEKCKGETRTKNKLLNELQGVKAKHDANVKLLKKEIVSKNTDIERLKSAMFYMNKFIANQGNERNMKVKSREMNVNNITSLSFEHDLDLEGTVADDAVEVESTKSHHVGSHINKKKPKKHRKSMKSRNHEKSSPANGDLLDDITAMVTNKKRSKSKGIETKYAKQKTKYNNKGGRQMRQFIPTSNNDAHYHNSRARRIALSKKKKKKKDMNGAGASAPSSSVQLASV